MVDIRSPRLRRLLTDWEARRKERALPSRKDFDPLDLKYILGNLSLLDVTYNPLQFRYRIQASALSERFGKELTNKSADEIPNAEQARLAREHFIEAIESRLPVLHVRDHTGIDVGTPHDCEILVLPLSADGGVVDILMSAIVWNDEFDAAKS